MLLKQAAGIFVVTLLSFLTLGLTGSSCNDSSYGVTLLCPSCAWSNLLFDWGDYFHFFPFLWTARLGEAAFVGLSAVRLFPGFVFGRFVPGMLRSGLGHELL